MFQFFMQNIHASISFFILFLQSINRTLGRCRSGMRPDRCCRHSCRLSRDCSSSVQTSW